MRHKKLKYYDERTPISIFENIASTKNQPCRDILNSDTSSISVKNIIVSRFEEYEEKINSLEKIEPASFTKEQKKCLEGCYTSETDNRNALINSIMRLRDVHAKAICCYCGVGSPNTIDHFLPKSVFPEFSVHSYNLIPCCAECNNIKDNYLIDPRNGERLFVNFYFDEIPDEFFLWATISRLDDGFVVEYMFEAPTRDEIYSIVSNHIVNLNIINRLEDISGSYIDDIYNQYQYSLSEGVTQQILKKTLAMNTSVLQRQHGKNYWKVALNNAILNCPDFFQQ